MGRCLHIKTRYAISTSEASLDNRRKPVSIQLKIYPNHLVVHRPIPQTAPSHASITSNQNDTMADTFVSAKKHACSAHNQWAYFFSWMTPEVNMLVPRSCCGVGLSKFCFWPADARLLLTSVPVHLNALLRVINYEWSCSWIALATSPTTRNNTLLSSFGAIKLNWCISSSPTSSARLSI